MNKLVKTSVAVIFALAATATVQAQKIGLKTNLLYWGAGGTINIGVEPKLTPKLTLDIELAGNPWRFSNKTLNRKIWHWTAQPEIRYWHAETFNRGFIGVHLMTGSFDLAGIKLPMGILPNLRSHRYEGWLAGFGASYGWQWYLGPHWNLEATFGFGYLYMKYNRFGCETCSDMDLGNAVKHYFGPTKVGISIEYLFRSKN